MTAKPYAEVIGDPITHSKSPLIHNFWLGKLGIDAEYRACHVSADELADYFTQRREDAAWRGCNVTMPYKRAVLTHVEKRALSAVGDDAANCVVPRDELLEAHNTDHLGVDAALRLAGGDDVSICLIGAGGAAIAVRDHLDVIIGEDFRLLARDESKAKAFLDEYSFDSRWFTFDDLAEAMQGARGVINASPLGMDGQARMPTALLDALALTTPDCFVFDMVYAPVDTELLKRARRLGRPTIDGLVMLIAQAGKAFELFFGQPAPREHDAELRALLTA